MMKDNIQRVRILADRKLCQIGIVWTVLMGIAISIPLVFFEPETEDYLSCFVFYSCWLFAILLSSPRWFASITLDEKGILFKAPFKKTQYTEYERYGYIYCGSYRHFGIIVKYVVVSQVKLNNYQLTHINNVPQSDKTIKILLNKENETKLEAIFPKRYIAQLNKQSWKNNTFDASLSSDEKQK